MVFITTMFHPKSLPKPSNRLKVSFIKRNNYIVIRINLPYCMPKDNTLDLYQYQIQISNVSNSLDE